MRSTGLYVVDGVRVMSVTEALGICGLTDMSGIPRDALENARLRGQEVHSWCELIDSGDISPGEAPDTSIEGYVAAYLKFKDESGFEVTGNESVVVHGGMRYAGTVDRCGFRRKLKEPSRPFTIDLKCVALVSEATRLQTTGYGAALDFMAGMKPGAHGRESLQLRGDGTYRLKQYSDAIDFYDWAAVVRVAHFKLNTGMAQLEN